MNGRCGTGAVGIAVKAECDRSVSACTRQVAILDGLGGIGRSTEIHSVAGQTFRVWQEYRNFGSPCGIHEFLCARKVTARHLRRDVPSTFAGDTRKVLGCLTLERSSGVNAVLLLVSVKTVALASLRGQRQKGCGDAV